MKKENTFTPEYIFVIIMDTYHSLCEFCTGV
jgi:hypothetical protein